MVLVFAAAVRKEEEEETMHETIPAGATMNVHARVRIE